MGALTTLATFLNASSPCFAARINSFSPAMQRIWADERPADRVPRPPPVARITPRTILTLRFDAFVTEEDDQRLALAL